MLRALWIVPLLVTVAWAKLPSASEVLKTDLIKKAKIRWVRVEKGAPLTIEIYAGEALRTNPDWQPGPVRVPYDLARNSNLERLLRAAHLGPPNRKPPKKGERTLELLVEGDKSWEVVGHWTRPARSWKKQLGEIYNALEPLCDVLADTFQPVKADAEKTHDLKLEEK
jgi:hypothetical protein